MKSFIAPSAALAMLLMAGAGCTTTPQTLEDPTPPEPVIDTSAEAVERFPAYFNHDNHYMVNDATTKIDGLFNAYPGKRITVDLHIGRGAERASVDLALYRADNDRHLTLVDRVQSASGQARTLFESSGGEPGAYVARLGSSGPLEDLELRLSCGADPCSPDPQPGEFCGGIAGIPCADGLYCDFPPGTNCGAYDQGGSCAARPDFCTKIYRPVCGCDGRTYGNDCEAASQGMSIRGEGECKPPVVGLGESCGGFTVGPAPVCDAGLYCHYEPDDLCGRADAAGTCLERPMSCTEPPAAVCGCDDATYMNACMAASNGVSVSHPGACEGPITN